MAEHPHATLVRTLFEALVTGDTEAALGCYAEDGGTGYPGTTW